MTGFRPLLLTASVALALCALSSARADIPPVPQAFDIAFDDASVRNDPKVGDAKWVPKGAPKTSTAKLVRSSAPDGTGQPVYIQELRHYLRQALSEYEAYGFALPDLPIKVSDIAPGAKGVAGSSGWTTLDGKIHIRRQPRPGNLAHTAAHEVFHAIQYVLLVPSLDQKVAGSVFSGFYGEPILWWQEATAEYAACYLGRPKPSDKPLCMGHGYVEPRFLSAPPNEASGNDVPYDWGHFIRFLADKKRGGRGAEDIKVLMIEIYGDLAEAWGREDGLKALDTYLEARSGSSLLGLAHWHRRFAAHFLLAKDRPLRDSASPDASVGQRQTFRIDAEEQAAPVTLMPSARAGSNTGIPYLTAGIGAVDFEFPDARPRVITAEISSSSHLADLYVLRRNPESTLPEHDYFYPESDPVPTLALDPQKRKGQIEVTKDEVLFLIATVPEESGGYVELTLRYDPFEACMASPLANAQGDDAPPCLDGESAHWFLGKWTCCDGLRRGPPEARPALTPVPAEARRPGLYGTAPHPTITAPPPGTSADDVNRILKGW